MLTALDPQPKSVGVQTTRRSYAADGSIFQEGPHAILIWDNLDDADAYVDILETFGLDTALTSQVTVRLRSEYFSDTLYNGTAILPEHGKDIGWEFMPRNLQILIRDLEQLVEA